MSGPKAPTPSNEAGPRSHPREISKMQTIHKQLRRAAVLLAAALLGSAGLVFGGGGATGTGGTMSYMAFGELSDFGSIFVNGIEFFTTNANITINGVPNRSQGDLKLGMVLTVTGAIDGSGKTGNAASVDYKPSVVGTIDRAAGGTSSFGVLGQAVTVDARTIYAGVLGVDELEAGTAVEVSGFATPSGILATRVERLGSVPSVQVQGTIAGLSGKTFSLGSLTVDASAAQVKNAPSGGLANGLTVVARGPAPSAGVLAATEVDVVVTNLSGNTNGSSAGIVQAVAGSSLLVNGLAITLTSNTQFVNGTAADLAAGKLVKVDYAIVSSTLVATRVEFTFQRDPSQVEADVTSTTASTLELLGPGGITITTNAATQVKDSSGGKGGNTFGFAQIAVGDHLVVRGNQVDAGVVLADRIERQRASTAIVVSGRARGVASPTFGLLDLVVTVDASTALFDELGAPLTPQAFFAAVSGHDVIVTLVRRDGGLAASAVRLD